MSSGALTPQKAVETLLEDAEHHLHVPSHLSFLKNIAGGLLVGLAGLTSFVIAGGCPGLHESNPGLVKFLEGSFFSTSLISVYFTGAELFTGYPMWLAMTALQKEGNPRQYFNAVVTSLTGNFIGAFTSAALFSYATGALTDDPYRSYVIEKVEDSILHNHWHQIFIKAIACGFLVTHAMLLGVQNLDGISKALSLWLPFVLATSSQFPHTVEYMHIVPTGMLLGANISISEFLWKCMLPIILGNTVGGAIFTGAYNWWIFIYFKNGEEKSGDSFGDTAGRYMDEE